MSGAVKSLSQNMIKSHVEQLVSADLLVILSRSALLVTIVTVQAETAKVDVTQVLSGCCKCDTPELEGPC